MSHRKIWALSRFGVALLALTGATVPGASLAGPLARANASPRSSDQLIVRFRDATPGANAEDAQTLGALHAAAARAGVQLKVLRRGWDNVLVLKLDRRLPDTALLALAREIREGDADVQFAEPDRIRHATFTPNDPNYTQQWHYYEPAAGISLPAAWNLTNGAGVVVAVIDTGYRRHVDLADNIIGGYDFISDPANARDGNGRDNVALDNGDWTNAGDCDGTADASDSSWHGTHVSGTIAAVTNNSVGVAGVAHGARVVPVRVLGKCGGYDSDISDAIAWAAGGTVSGVPLNQHPAKVLNMSLGGYGACPSSYQKAIDDARSRGAVVVVAAGNDGDIASNYAPANCRGVITVGAVGRTGNLTDYSNYGDTLSISAPGGDMTQAAANGVLSTSNDGAHAPGNDAYYYYEGTSMASPHVAGVAALMFARNASLTPNQLLARMRSTAKIFPNGSCDGCGAGIVDAFWATKAATAASAIESENNGTIGTAQVITANEAVITGTIGTGSDIDFYRVTLSAGQTLRASMAPTSGARDFELYLVDGNGAVLRSSERSAGQTERVIFENTGASNKTVFVKVIGYGGGTGGYTLTSMRY